jgi:solute carrier family 20 (sodium-dependent phosphate transporter)
VFSAICVIFAHGANDSAFAAGPLAGIYTVYQGGFLPSKVVPEIWIVFIAAFSMVVGLATYGYNVTRAVGTKLSKLSASRGFAAELSTAIVILIASQYALAVPTCCARAP